MSFTPTRDAALRLFYYVTCCQRPKGKEAGDRAGNLATAWLATRQPCPYLGPKATMRSENMPARRGVSRGATAPS